MLLTRWHGHVNLTSDLPEYLFWVLKCPNKVFTSFPLMPPTTVNLSDALFSTTQQRVLGLLFGQPDRSFYATEMIGLAGVGSGGVQRELARLAQSGLVTVRPVGNQKHYQANPDAPVYAELCGIVRKTFGMAEPLRLALTPLAGQIKCAFVYGSVAKRQDTASSDIDLMVISDRLGYADIFAALEVVGTQLGRTVNPTIYSPRELSKRIAKSEAFVTRVLAQPKLWLIGGDDDLRV
jgi:predicted nucleotidyltransferase